MFFIVDTEVFFLSHLYNVFPKLVKEPISINAYIEVLRTNNNLNYPVLLGEGTVSAEGSFWKIPINTFR